MFVGMSVRDVYSLVAARGTANMAHPIEAINANQAKEGGPERFSPTP